MDQKKKKNKLRIESPDSGQARFANIAFFSLKRNSKLLDPILNLSKCGIISRTKSKKPCPNSVVYHLSWLECSQVREVTVQHLHTEVKTEVKISLESRELREVLVRNQF